MAVTWAYKGRSAADFEDLLRCYRASELASPRRSTVPLLAYWSDAERRLSEFSSMVGVSLSDGVLLDFEHEVPVQRGIGQPSCTDLMILGKHVAAAVEAKFTESRYEPVRTWLHSPPDANRDEVLSGWLTLLSQSTRRRLTTADVLDLPYQLVHRAAAACYTHAREPWLVYQVFDVPLQKHEIYCEDLRALATLLGDDRRLAMRLVDCVLVRNERYTTLEATWDSGERDLHEEVIHGLITRNLLQVSVRQVVAV